MGDPEAAEDPRHASNALRRAARAEIVAKIQALLRSETRAHWLALFEQARVPSGPINSVSEVCDDEALHARCLFYRLDGEGSPVPQVGTGLWLDGRANGARRPPLKLGADTQAVLREWLAN